MTAVMTADALADPAAAASELADIRTQMTALIARLDRIDDAGDLIAHYARNNGVPADDARRYANAIAGNAASAAGHLRHADGYLNTSRVRSKRLADVITDASKGQR